jgi:type II secretory pathway pseudopilin PulG
MKKYLTKIFGDRSGQSLIELLVAMGLISILLPAILSGIIASRGGRAQNEQRITAVELLKDTQEAVRSIHARDWTLIQNNGTYHPEISGENWVLAVGSNTQNGFTTAVVIDDVYRDVSGAIVTSGGILDPSTKEVFVTVSWNTPFASSISSTNYLTRFVNDVDVQTTVADFTPGASNAATMGIAITNSSGGEVTLGAGGGGDWCNPSEYIVEDLDYPGQAEARAITAIEGNLFTGTGRNASGLPFGHISVTDTDPPVASLVGSYSNVSPGKSNDVFGEEDFAYIGTDGNLREIVIIDLNTNPYTEEGYFNPTGNNRGISVFVEGNVGYMTTLEGSTFRTFDLSSKAGSRPELDQVTLAGVGNSIYVRGNYAYVAVNSTSTQLQIIDVSSPSNISIVASVSVSNVVGRDVFINDSETRAFLVTANSASNPEFFILDITNKNNPSIISGGTYDVGGMSPNGLRVVPGGRAIIVGEGAANNYQVLNISDEAAPTNCGNLTINSSVYAIDAVLEADGDAYSYIATSDSSSEIKIIEGGPGGSFSENGTFESDFFDAGFTVAFNRIIPNFLEPNQTDIQFQVASADAVAGSCAGANYSFVGPDGTSSTYYSTAGLVPFMNNGSGYINPGRCFKYRVNFSTTDQFSAPILYDFSINYSF